MTTCLSKTISLLVSIYLIPHLFKASFSYSLLPFPLSLILLSPTSSFLRTPFRTFLFFSRGAQETKEGENYRTESYEPATAPPPSTVAWTRKPPSAYCWRWRRLLWRGHGGKQAREGMRLRRETGLIALLCTLFSITSPIFFFLFCGGGGSME